MTDTGLTPLPDARPSDEAARFIQIEITTVCNFACFYCAGRAMPQRHMVRSQFNDILHRIPAGQPDITVSLQGEGEPTLHPQFWELVAAVNDHGARPYTITNASRVDPALFDRHLPTVGVSLDTVDPVEAGHIGRHRLPKVLDNLEALLAVMAPHRIAIHTVDFGQPLTALRAFVAGLGGVKHIVQPLQRKADYLRHYPGAAQKVASGGIQWPAAPRRRSCDYLEWPRMRYFTVDGTELPCCYIKEVPADFSVVRLRDELSAGRVPSTCLGCRQLR